MAIDSKNVMSTLRKMSDPQLQQYAAMHKNDPYIFPLAFQESQTRKQIRAEAQAAQAMPQGKVNDQNLAAMAPEDVGIGTLPADNLRGIATGAAGGLVSFGEGGEVPRYQGLGPSLVRLPPQQPYAGVLGDIPGYTQGQPILPQAGQPDPADMTVLEKWRRGIPLLSSERARLEAAAKQTPAATPTATPPAAAPAATPPATTGTVLPPAPGGAGAAPAADTGAQLRPGGNLGLGFKPGEGLGLGTRPSTYSAELEAMQPQGEVRSPFESQIRAAGLAETKAAREYKDLREQQIKEAGLAGVDQERRLTIREEKLAKTESDVGGLALLKAGFAIMSGSSPFALQNIGSGAQVGVEEYVKGREKIDVARERLDDAFDRLDQVRRGELVMNQKEQAQLQRDVNKTIAQTEKDVLAGAREAYGWKKEDTRAAFNAYVADRRTNAELTSRERLGLAQIASHERTAAITAGAPLAMYSALGSAQPGSPLLKGFEMSKQEAQIPRLYGEYMKLISDPLKGDDARARFPTFTAFMEGMGGYGGGQQGFVQPPTNAPVLRAPGTR